jgi:RNA polymerase sigma-70 factor (ECF subfamily)
VARNLLIDADRAAQSRPVTVAASPADDPADDSALAQVLDRQLVCDALQHLSPAHRTVLVETFYRGGSTATVARQLGIPGGTARSRLHYALDALRRHLQDQEPTRCRLMTVCR